MTDERRKFKGIGVYAVNAVEFADLTAERYALCEEYYKLKDDVKSVEFLRRSAENIMSADAPEREPKRTQDISL